MNLAPILTAVLDRTGLDPATLGTHAVRAAVGERLRALGLTEPEYAARISGDAAEFSRLVADVVVPETWFFRGGDVFAHAADLVRQSSVARPFRVLSLPCSTGEEPYSLAITLSERGVPASRCTIDGVDVSPRAIEVARAGVYGELSFRQTSAEMRRRHFRSLPRGAEIDPALRESVRFQVGNILDRALLLFEKPYDLVFCRNLFIYFTPEARRRGLDALARLVAPGGFLALGHAEAVAVNEKRFERAGPLAFFLYRRTPGAAP
jgi:chemotaxis protein methyltransferase WspC